MSDSYVKLFSSITESTIWGEPAGTRLVWITLLAKSNRKGEWFGAVPGLAHAARVSLPECQQALNTLLAPDPWSRTPDFEGRRIEAIEGGWRILNRARFDRNHSEIEAEERERERKREWDRQNRPSGAARQKIYEAQDKILGTQSDENPTQSDAVPTQSVPPVAVAVAVDQKLESPDGDSVALPATGKLELKGGEIGADVGPVQTILNVYHDVLPLCRRISVVHQGLQKKILAVNKLAGRVCREQGWRYSVKHFWRAYFERCAMDAWMRGEVANPRNPRWRQHVGVLIDEERFAEIMNDAIETMRADQQQAAA